MTEAEQTTVSAAGWSSHLPVLRAAVRVYEPEVALEFGCGVYSTKFLAGAVRDIVAVDHSQSWVTKIQAMAPDATCLCYAPPAQITQQLRYSQLDRDTILQVHRDYKRLARLTGDTRVGLCFIDSGIGDRVIALNAVGPVFSITVYHDCEPESQDIYQYHATSTPPGYKRHVLSFRDTVLNGHPCRLPWTGVLIEDALMLPRFKDAVLVAASDFLGQYGIESKFAFESVADSDARPEA